MAGMGGGSRVPNVRVGEEDGENKDNGVAVSQAWQGGRTKDKGSS